MDSFVPTTAPASAAPFIASASHRLIRQRQSHADGEYRSSQSHRFGKLSGSIQLRFDGIIVTSAANIACTTASRVNWGDCQLSATWLPAAGFGA